MTNQEIARITINAILSGIAMGGDMLGGWEDQYFDDRGHTAREIGGRVADALGMTANDKGMVVEHAQGIEFLLVRSKHEEFAESLSFCIAKVIETTPA